MGGDPDNKLIDMLEGKLRTSKIKPILYTFTGILCPIPLILLAIILKFPQLLLAASFFLYLNIGIYQTEAKNIKAKGISKLTLMGLLNLLLYLFFLKLLLTIELLLT